MLDWYPNAVHSFIYAAIEKGYFKEEGVKVNIKFPSNPTDPLTLAAAGKVTVGLYYQPDVVMARANEQIPVKSIGAVVRSPLNHVVSLKSAGIQSPKDLEGLPPASFTIVFKYISLNGVPEYPTVFPSKSFGD